MYDATLFTAVYCAVLLVAACVSYAVQCRAAVQYAHLLRGFRYNMFLYAAPVLLCYAQFLLVRTLHAVLS